MGHYFPAEELERPKGMLGREIAEGKDAEQVVGGRNVQQALEFFQRRGRAADDQGLGRLRIEGVGPVCIRPAKLAREVMDVTDPRGVRRDAEALRFVVGLGDYEVLRLGEIR